jgi:DNA-directed RNA polymerase specialized sigma24 family protein
LFRARLGGDRASISAASVCSRGSDCGALSPLNWDGIVSPGAPPDVAAELRALYAAIERFPAEERIALILRRVEGFALRQIAEHMNSSESTLKRRLRAAEARLARCALDNER